MLEAFPRLHPILLHLPIGVLVALAWVQLWGRFAKGSTEPVACRRPLVCLLLLSTFPTALTGWLLHESASYPDPVELHENFGVAFLIVTLLMGLAEFKKPKFYEPLLWIAVLLLFPTGHLGGTLTHGEDFLFGRPERETPPEPVAQPPTSAPVEETYESVRPILEELCMHCHGERKQRGDLAMHTMESLLKGSEFGSVWTPGDLEGSRIWQVLSSPVDDDEHMPPANKSQPSGEELARLKAWIASPAK